METPIFVTKPYLPPREEFDRYMDLIWENHYLTNFGGLSQQLEKELAEYLQVPAVALTSNGHMALELCLSLFGLEEL